MIDLQIMVTGREFEAAVRSNTGFAGPDTADRRPCWRCFDSDWYRDLGAARSARIATRNLPASPPSAAANTTPAATYSNSGCLGESAGLAAEMAVGTDSTIRRFFSSTSRRCFAASEPSCPAQPVRPLLFLPMSLLFEIADHFSSERYFEKLPIPRKRLQPLIDFLKCSRKISLRLRF